MSSWRPKLGGVQQRGRPRSGPALPQRPQRAGSGSARPAGRSSRQVIPRPQHAAPRRRLHRRPPGQHLVVHVGPAQQLLQGGGAHHLLAADRRHVLRQRAALGHAHRQQPRLLLLLLGLRARRRRWRGGEVARWRRGGGGGEVEVARWGRGASAGRRCAGAPMAASPGRGCWRASRKVAAASQQAVHCCARARARALAGPPPTSWAHLLLGVHRPAALVDEAHLAPQRRQPPVCVVRAQQQPVLAPGGA
jgi:hypothetical protein